MNLKVADVKVILEHGDVRGLNHKISTLEIAQRLSVFRIDDKNGRDDGIDDDDAPVRCCRQSGHDFNKTDADATQKHATFVEDLKRSFISVIDG